MNGYFWMNVKRRKICYVGFSCKTKKVLLGYVGGIHHVKLRDSRQLVNFSCLPRSRGIIQENINSTIY